LLGSTVITTTFSAERMRRGTMMPPLLPLFRPRPVSSTWHSKVRFCFVSPSSSPRTLLCPLVVGFDAQNSVVTPSRTCKPRPGHRLRPGRFTRPSSLARGFPPASLQLLPGRQWVSSSSSPPTTWRRTASRSARQFARSVSVRLRSAWTASLSTVVNEHPHLQPARWIDTFRDSDSWDLLGIAGCTGLTVNVTAQRRDEGACRERRPGRGYSRRRQHQLLLCR
jgi:hypothetical protein